MIVFLVIFLTVLFLISIGAWASNLEGQRKMQIERESQIPKVFIR